MNTLSLWILSVLFSIAPSQSSYHENDIEFRERYENISKDMADAIIETKPIFNDENSNIKTAALLTSIAFYESGFRKDIDYGNIRGDHGNSWCLMQINVYNQHVRVGNKEIKSWTGKDLVLDRKKCFIAAIESIRESMNYCSKLKAPSYISGYTTGKCIKNEKNALYRWNYAINLIKKYPYNNILISKENLTSNM